MSLMNDLVMANLVMMCASCWRIQPLHDELGSALDQWIDPTAFMARGQLEASAYRIVDGYCDPCLAEMAARDSHAMIRASRERINA
ncbi:MAG TPA: hypothetical protein VFS39_07875 [Nitrospira sp.]|nr:hypothetical protein [Nitrospira sp.]